MLLALCLASVTIAYVHFTNDQITVICNEMCV